jgi:uncharacterized protein
MTTYYERPSKPPRGARNKVRRHAERAHYDRKAVEAILDATFVGHVSFVVDGLPHATPMLYVREGDQLYLHGAPRSRLLQLMAGGAPLCVTVMLIDGLVLARSWFHHSVNYRSVVVFGEGRPVRERDEKLEAMRKLVDQIVPGRAADSRGPTATELKATEIIAMTISEASAKVRIGNPIDLESDHALPTWAGQLPMHLAAGEPLADDYSTADVPDYVRALFNGRP